MAEYELDKWDIKTLHELSTKGRLNLRPDYQRSKVWTDSMKYDLIDSVLHDWPMGIIMVNVIPDVDSESEPIKRYDIVDGQQRLSTLFEYRDGSSPWATPLKPPTKYSDFRPYSQLSSARQDRIDSYKIALALMKDYEEDDILDIFNRLQHSKPLVIGEKVKALRSAFKPALLDLVKHKAFEIAPSYRNRDAQWNLAALCFKAVYKSDPYHRQEYQHLEDFLKQEPYNEAAAKKAEADTRQLLNFERKVLEEAQEIAPGFKDINSLRLFKWLFVALQSLVNEYSLSGREHLVAKGLVEYYAAKDGEGSDEWIAYYKTGRTGRIDTADVKDCVGQLMDRIILTADASPLDPKRLFTPEQRRAIFEKSNGQCATCGIPLSKNNFHADHIVPHSQGGATTVSNGQALCTKCNREKRASLVLHANPS